MFEKQQESLPVERHRADSVSSLVRSAPSRIWVHAKLEMSSAGDSDESEADSVADAVASCRKVRRHISGSGGDGTGVLFPAHLESSLLSGQGGGFTMPSTIRKPMEDAFGRDFSDVRFHSDGESSRLSRSISARAFTYGNDIYFARGQYNPGTSAGRHLIAHELTHVVQGNGKVSREPDHSEQRAIIQTYFIDNWHWGQFYTYLAIFHPQVVDALKLELDAGFFDTDWKEDRGINFMKEVSSAIVNDIRRRNNNMNWNDAYARAIREFRNCGIRLYPKIKPAFDCLIYLTEKGRDRNVAGNSRSFGNISAQRKKDLATYSFDGNYFNNGESFLRDVYAFFKNEYPDALSYFDHFSFIFQSKTIEGVSDMEEMRSARFAKELEPYIDNFISERARTYIKSSGRTGKAAETEAMNLFLCGFIREVAAHEKKYRAAGMLREVAESRLKYLYSTEFHVPEALVSADAWTELFFRIMLEGGSMMLGGPLVGKIMSAVIIRNPVARLLIEQAANTALDFISGAGEEMIMEKVKGDELNAKKILQEAGMSALVGRLFDWGMQGAPKYAGMLKDGNALKETDDILLAGGGNFLKKVGNPPKKVGNPLKTVGNPLKKVGNPLKKVGNPGKSGNSVKMDYNRVDWEREDYIDLLPDGTYKVVTHDRLPAVASGSPRSGKNIRDDDGDIIDIDPTDFWIDGVRSDIWHASRNKTGPDTGGGVTGTTTDGVGALSRRKNVGMIGKIAAPDVDNQAVTKALREDGIPDYRLEQAVKKHRNFSETNSGGGAMVLKSESDRLLGKSGDGAMVLKSESDRLLGKSGDGAMVLKSESDRLLGKSGDGAMVLKSESDRTPGIRAASSTDEAGRNPVLKFVDRLENSRIYNLDEIPWDYAYRKAKGLPKGAKLAFKDYKSYVILKKLLKASGGFAAAFYGSRMVSDKDNPSAEDYASGAFGAMAAVSPLILASLIAVGGEYATQNWSSYFGDAPLASADLNPAYPVASGLVTYLPLSTYWGPFAMGGIKLLDRYIRKNGIDAFVYSLFQNPDDVFSNMSEEEWRRFLEIPYPDSSVYY